MKIFTKLDTPSKGKPGREGAVNLWRQWVDDPDAIRVRLREDDALRPEDSASVRGWAERQEEWGLRVRVHDGATGLPQFLEVFGPDGLEPHVLVRRVGEEVQVDEYHGASRLCPDMAEALDFVAGHT